MLVLSLFPGLGLLDMAFEQEGFCVVRGPDVIWGGDIRRFHPPSGKFDGVVGGPPGQTFSSLANLVRANGHEPKFGNLIPEFERCVSEAEPDWFLMENVPAAPEPVVSGYGVQSFLLDNSMLDAGDGWGQEQRRVRRFSFGVRGRDAKDLRRWIDLAVFVLPDAERAVTQFQVDNSQQAKRRKQPVTAGHDSIENTNEWSKRAKTRKRTCTALGPEHLQGLRESTQREAERRRQVCVTSTDGGERPSEKTQANTVSSSASGNGKQRPHNGGNTKQGRYRLADACRLQGLPEDFLADAPFTADGKLKAVANGVPLFMGRAIARAVKESIG